MVAHRLVTRGEIARHARRHLAYRWRGEHAGHVTDMRDRALTLGAGLSVDAVVALSEEVYDDRLARRLWNGTQRLAQHHLECGDPVWLATAAPVELARIVAARLGYSGALGTVAEVRDGRWTGRLAGEVLHGQAKADAVGTLADERGLCLARCAAYSDSINDLPLLEIVGHPHAVNPDRALARIARERGWPLHDFRPTRRALRILRPEHAALVTALEPDPPEARMDRNLVATEPPRDSYAIAHGCQADDRDLRGVVQCLLAAQYSECEIIDYLSGPFGLTWERAVAAVRQASGRAVGFA